MGEVPRRRAGLVATSTALVALTGLLLLGPTFALAAPAGATTAAPARTLRPPTDAVVVEVFRAPATPYGPGNRGLDYATRPGTTIRAAAAGTVSFAGQVGGIRHVVVAHPDGLRTTYADVAAALVRVGDEVVAGQPVATASAHLHFGVRRGTTYLDPATLLVTPPAVVAVHLVPHDLRPGFWAAYLRATDRPGSPLGRLAGSAFGFGTDVIGSVAVALTPLAALEHLGLLTDVIVGEIPYSWLKDQAAAIPRWWSQRNSCTSRGTSPPTAANRDHLVVLVAGYGSSGAGSIGGFDVAALGYDPSRVLQFSYAGGVLPDATDDPAATAGLPSNPSTTAESLGPLDASATELRDVLIQLARRHPGVPVDVIAHSQGGVVAVRAAQDPLPGEALVDPRPLPDDLTIVTLGSPHQGSTLADAVAVATSRIIGSVVAEVAPDLPYVPEWADTSSAAFQDLIPGSDFFEGYHARRLPEGVDVTSVGARFDATVASFDTLLAGASQVVVNGASHPFGAHDALPRDPSATREVALAVAGMEPSCRNLVEFQLDAFAAATITATQQQLAVAVAATTPEGRHVAGGPLALYHGPAARPGGAPRVP